MLRTCIGLYLLLCTFLLTAIIGRELHIGMVPVQLDYEEGNILNAGVRIINGLNPYPVPQPTPEALNPYGPITYYVVALLLKTFGISFGPPRIVVLLFEFAVGSLLALLVRHFTGSWILAFGAAITYLLMDVPLRWLLHLRVDFIGLGFAMLGLYIYAIRPRLVMLYISLFAIALFTKYSLLAAPVACFVDQLLHRRYRRAVLFASVLALICLTVFGIMQVWTESAFAFHMFQTHPDPTSLRRWARRIYSAANDSAPLSLAALFYIGAMLKEKSMPLPFLYLVIVTFSTFTAAKLGSSSNHMLEFLAALTICAALGMFTLYARGNRIILTSLLLLMGFWVPWKVGQSRLTSERQASERAGCLKLYEYIAAAPGIHVLSENTGAVVLARKPVPLSNPFVYTQLVRAGKWSDRDLVQKLEAKQFELIVRQQPWDKERWTDGSIEAIEGNYQVAAHFACPYSQLVLVPRT